MKTIHLANADNKNAGLKAPRDIDKVLYDNFDCEVITIKNDKLWKIRALMVFLRCHFSKDIIILQNLVGFNDKVYKLLKSDNVVLLIHDIPGLAKKNEEETKQAFAIYRKIKHIIVHNEAMKKLLVDNGVNPKNIYLLEMFDYLADGQIKKDYIYKNQMPILLYPGTLNRQKSPFIYQLDSEKLKFSINLYGLGISDDISNKLRYKGVFDAEKIDVLDGDIGLIWDGNLDESDENSIYKNYTKYNNPHKLSCCLAIGIPVIVWKKAAVAKFVTKYNVGYTISNLYDINDINFTDYKEKRENAIKIGEKIRDGYYTKRVINEIILNKNNI